MIKECPWNVQRNLAYFFCLVKIRNIHDFILCFTALVANLTWFTTQASPYSCALQSERMWIKKCILRWNHLPVGNATEISMAATNHSFILKSLMFPWESETGNWRCNIKASTGGLNLRQWGLAHFLSTSNSVLDRRTQCKNTLFYCQSVSVTWQQ